jgi:hypothetical protein
VITAAGTASTKTTNPQEMIVRAKPTAADILIAIGNIEAGDWFDPIDEPTCWSCFLYDPEGQRVGDGHAHTERGAMALAWVCVEAPDALINGHVRLGEVSFEVPDGWRFQLVWRGG